MEIMKAKIALDFLNETVKCLKDEPLSRGTFDKMVQAGLFNNIGGSGTRIFDASRVREIAALFPAIRPADKLGLVNYLKDRLDRRKRKAG